MKMAVIVFFKAAQISRAGKLINLLWKPLIVGNPSEEVSAIN